ncbi:hypothetical protein D3P08_14030 [Paenibacillus nanensis]|uniref:Uncharacterized protein n=1 Tax=Paenibacillus nanensis TaxID=393251 RepID=A0A3A1V0F5_9BACL|nr:hypothetical protein D3P08_14030 [Paenibacillus nanensis]
MLAEYNLFSADGILEKRKKGESNRGLQAIEAGDRENNRKVLQRGINWMQCGRMKSEAGDESIKQQL